MFELLSTFMYHHIEDLPKGLASYRHLCMQISAANEVEADESTARMGSLAPAMNFGSCATVGYSKPQKLPSTNFAGLAFYRSAA